MTEILQVLFSDQKHRKIGPWQTGIFPVVYSNGEPFFLEHPLISHLHDRIAWWNIAQILPRIVGARFYRIHKQV